MKEKIFLGKKRGKDGVPEKQVIFTREINYEIIFDLFFVKKVMQHINCNKQKEFQLIFKYFNF